MKRFLLTVIFSSFCYLLSLGQNNNMPFRQYYFNPSLFNPAFTGINGYTEVYLVYRKQWINFNDAPTTMGFNLQYPTAKRVSLGLNVMSQEVVALNNTSATATFGYAIPLATNQSLRFGISGGVGTNRLKLEEGEYDPNDPVIADAVQNNFYVDGNFGAAYTNHGFRLGFTLTNLFDNRTTSLESFNEVKFSQLSNRLYSISYKFNLVPDVISVEPYFLYREKADKQNWWEAAAVVYFKDKLWLGGSYHETNGIGIFAGLSIVDKLRFGYSYELPPANNNFINTSSHEIHLSLRFGKRRGPQTQETIKPETYTGIDTTKTVTPDEVKAEEVKEEPVVTEEKPVVTETSPVTQETKPVVEETKPVVEETKPIIEEKKPVVTENTPVTEEKQTVVTEKPVTEKPVTEVKKPVKKPSQSFTLGKGNYVVVGAFRILDNASEYMRDLYNKGFQANIALNAKNNLYYVYIFSSFDLEEARKARNQYRLRRPFSEAWLYTVE